MKNRYFYLMLIGTLFSSYIIYLPGYMCRNLFEGGIVAIPIGLMISCFIYFLYMNILNEYKNSNLHEINKNILGEYIGGFFSVLYVIFNYAMGLILFRGIIEIIRKLMLPNTSFWIIGGILICIPLLADLNRRESFLYLLSFFSVIIVVSILIYFVISIKNVELYWIEGTLRHSILEGEFPNISLIGMTCFYFSGFDNMVYLNPKFKKYNKKIVLIIVAIGGLLSIFISILIPTSIWGSVLIKQVDSPWILTADTISVDLFIIERAMFIFLPLFLLSAIYELIRVTYSAGGICRKIIKNNKSFNITRFIILSYVPLVYLLEKFEVAIYLYILTKLSYLVFTLILLIILFSISKLRRNKK